MINDKKIDLTEESVFGIRESLKNIPQIPWLVEEFDYDVKNKIRFSDGLNSWINISYSSISSNGNRVNMYLNDLDEISTNITSSGNSYINNSTYSNSTEYIYRWYSTISNSDNTIQFNSISDIDNVTSIYSPRTIRIELQSDTKFTDNEKDVFGFPRSHSSERKLNSDAKGKESIEVCYRCGKLIGNKLWGGKYSKCQCSKDSEKSYDKDNPWPSMHKSGRLMSRRNRFFEYDYDDAIPWETEEEIHEREVSRRLSDDRKTGRDRYLMLIPWLKHQKSYFGIGGKIDWVGIEDEWKMREMDLGVSEENHHVKSDHEDFVINDLSTNLTGTISNIRFGMNDFINSI